MYYGNEYPRLVDHIGVPALLEQTAEEATELAFACLKLARYIRGENKVYGHTEEELYNNLAEEMADIRVCFEELHKGDVISQGKVIDEVSRKYIRMWHRLEEGG